MLVREAFCINLVSTLLAYARFNQYSRIPWGCYCLPMEKAQKDARATVTTKVVGGIGNQLFCYFAGYYLAKKLESTLKVDVSDIRNKRSVHDVSIEALDLPGIFFAYPENQIQDFFSRVRNKLIKLFPFLGRLDRVHISKSIGFDPEMEEIRTPIAIQGYFQSYKYFEEFTKDKLLVALKHPSTWYSQMQNDLSGKEFTVIHVRRGDYRALSTTFGLLGAKYYEEALLFLGKSNNLHRVYVFSDDIQAAQKMLGRKVPPDTVWINPPQESNAVESLLLMSLAKSNIIANSTYSWWGAALAQEKDCVVAPKKWFRAMDDPQDIYPPNWHLIESNWED